MPFQAVSSSNLCWNVIISNITLLSLVEGTGFEPVNISIESAPLHGLSQYLKHYHSANLPNMSILIFSLTFLLKSVYSPEPTGLTI